MSENHTADGYAARMKLFIKNRQEFPLDELDHYTGKCIAWSPDGTSVLASADDLDILDKLVRDLGHDPSQCVFSYVDGESTI